jgi:phosphonate transport system substrate-binding protein
MVKIFVVLLGGAWAALAGGAEQAAEDARRYSFGVVPQQSASKLARSWSPLLQHLGQRADVEIRFRTAPDIPEFERRLAAGEYDLAYMNPYHYTVFSREPGYRAFAKASDKLIRGILVVRQDSPVRAPRDLDGSTIAFPAPAAFAASVLTRAYLNGESIAFTPKYVSSHDSVYRTVAAGLYPAGGGVMRTLNSVEPEIRAQLRVLYTTPGYTPHAFAAHPRMPGPIVARLVEAMQAMSEDAQGRALLEPLNIQGFEAAADGDWDDVRALDIDLLDDIAAPAP